MEVSTTQYEFAHGKKPRGEGYWAFFFDGQPEAHFFPGFYRDAKKSAIAYAVAKGFTRISVGS